MRDSEPLDINQEDVVLLRALIGIWSGLFAVGVVLYSAVVFICWPV
jgi:hypothetical protein